MAKKEILNDRNWIILASHTREPKLGYLIKKLNHAGIETEVVHVRGEKKLLVPYSKIVSAWKQLRPDLDNMPDDHPFFARWKRSRNRKKR